MVQNRCKLTPAVLFTNLVPSVLICLFALFAFSFYVSRTVGKASLDFSHAVTQYRIAIISATFVFSILSVIAVTVVMNARESKAGMLGYRLALEMQKVKNVMQEIISSKKDFDMTLCVLQSGGVSERQSAVRDWIQRIDRQAMLLQSADTAVNDILQQAGQLCLDRTLETEIRMAEQEMTEVNRAILEKIKLLQNATENMRASWELYLLVQNKMASHIQEFGLRE